MTYNKNNHEQQDSLQNLVSPMPTGQKYPPNHNQVNQFQQSNFLQNNYQQLQPLLYQQPSNLFLPPMVMASPIYSPPIQYAPQYAPHYTPNYQQQYPSVFQNNSTLLINKALVDGYNQQKKNSSNNINIFHLSI